MTQTTNVIRLPTAARRKVQQGCNRWTRAAREELREAQPWPGEYLPPGQRKAMPLAEILLHVEHSPELSLALAIAAELDEDTRLRVIGRIAKNGSPFAREAIALVRAETATIGEKWDLLAAMERVRKKGSSETGGDAA